MPGIKLDEAKKNLQEAIVALKKARESTSYSIADRSITKPNLKALQDEVKFWNDMVNELSDDNQGIVVEQVVPTDD